MEQIELLGKIVPISVQPGAEGVVDQVLPVIQGAVSVLNGHFVQGQLTATDIEYVGALQGLGIAMQRSFTPCAGTADDADGEFVFFFGAADVLINPDPLWYASTIIHDGGHAWLSQQGQVSVGVPVEQMLTQLQIDYYKTIDGPASYIDSLTSYKNDPAAIQSRIDQAV